MIRKVRTRREVVETAFNNMQLYLPHKNYEIGKLVCVVAQLLLIQHNITKTIRINIHSKEFKICRPVFKKSITIKKRRIMLYGKHGKNIQSLGL